MKIFNQLIEVIIRKRPPEEVDYSIPAAVACCLGSVLFYFFVYSSFQQFTQPLLYGVILTTSNALAILVLLKFHNKETRFVQTITLLFGTSLILSSIAILAAITGYLAIFSVFIIVYSLVLSVSILKSSFSCPTPIAIIILIATHFFSANVLVIVCPNYSAESVAMIESLQRQPGIIEQQQTSK